MNAEEAKESIREMLRYILDVDDNDVIEGYALTLDDIIESYAKEKAIAFLEYCYPYSKIKTKIGQPSHEQLYSEWIKQQNE